MDERLMYFGDYIKLKRKNKEFTLTETAMHLGIQKSHYSEIENKRRAPFDGEKMELFAEYLNLSDDETAILFDLASKYNREVPYDIADIFMHGEVGEHARTALRLSKDCNIPEAEWKQLIRALEANKAEKKRGDADGSNKK